VKARSVQLLAGPLDGKVQYVVPVFQREYNWKLTQVGRLWKDVVAAGTTETSASHFFGSVVYIQSSATVSQGMQVVLIDGQQRLTTVTLMIAALKVYMKTVPDDGLSQDYVDDYLFFRDADGQMQRKVILGQADDESLSWILKGDVDHHPIQPHLMENYASILKNMTHSRLEPKVIWKGLQKLTVVDVTLEKGTDNAQAIFESLNATGLGLSQSDLVRNYVLMNLAEREQQELFSEYWHPMTQLLYNDQDKTDSFDGFLRDYLTVQSSSGDIPRLDEIYEGFKSHREHLSSVSTRDLLAAMKTEARRYVRISRPMFVLAHRGEAAYDAPGDDADVLKRLSGLNGLDATVAYPFLLDAYGLYERAGLSKGDMLEVLDMVESYIVRRLVYGLATNSLAKTFARLAREVDENDYVESLRGAFLGMKGSRRFPLDHEFREELKTRDVYHIQSRTGYLLERLENWGKKEHISSADYTVEHIMPQKKGLTSEWRNALGADWATVQERYLHVLGNLTLTGYNSEYSDRPFIQKRDLAKNDILIGFSGSPVGLNGRLAHLDHWDASTIEERTNELSELACRVWPVPVASVELPGDNHVAAIVSSVIGDGADADAARTLCKELWDELEAASATHVLAVTGNDRRISFNVGIWLVLRLVRSSKGGGIKMAVDSTLLPPELLGDGFKPFSARILGQDEAPFESQHYGLVSVNRSPTELLSGPLHTAWIAAVTTAAKLFKSWKTGAFAHQHNSGILGLLVPGSSPHGQNSYDIFLVGSTGELFAETRTALLGLDAEMTEEHLKYYVAFKLETNVVDIIPQSGRLKVYFNMPFASVRGHEGFVHDVSHVGHWANGEVMAEMLTAGQLPDIIDVARQALEYSEK